MTLPTLAPCPSGVSDDDWAAVCEGVRAYCEWHIAPSITETITLRGHGEESLIVPTLMLTNVTGVTAYGEPVTAPRWEEWGTVYPGTTDLPGWSGFTWWGEVVMTVTHGYVTCPMDLIGVMEAAVQAKVPASAAGGRVQAGPFSRDYTGRDPGVSFTPGQYGVLDRYRLGV